MMECQFLTPTNTRCRQNRYHIHINHPFEVPLCEQHIKLISKDHLTQYYQNKHINNSYYDTFSIPIRNRFLSNNTNILLQQNKENYLVEHEIIYQSNFFYKIKLLHSSYVFLIQKILVNNNNIIRNLNLSPEFNELIIPNNSLNMIHLKINTIQNVDTNIIYIYHCDICCYQSTEKKKSGFKLKCCNEKNDICIECIIKLLFVEYTKYNNVNQINNYELMNNDINCPYCRHKNNYSELKNNIEFKRIFKLILNDKLQEYYREKVTEQLILFE